MWTCEACGRQTHKTYRSILGTKPICLPCKTNHAESPKQLAYVVRECRRTGRSILPGVKARIRIHAGEGKYMTLKQYERRATHQQLIVVEQRRVETKEQAECEIILAGMRRASATRRGPATLEDVVNSVIRRDLASKPIRPVWQWFTHFFPKPFFRRAA